MKGIRITLAELCPNNRGNALVETALYMPFALLLLAGVVDYSSAVSQKLQAQQAVARTLEMVSNLGVSGLSETLLKAEAAQSANVSQDAVTARIWLECDGVVQPDPTAGCSSSDGLARYASVTIRDNYELSFYSSFANSVPDDESLVFQAYGSVRIQ